MVSDELWCCWVLYRELNAGGYEELLSGGVGFAQSAICTYVQEHMEKLRCAARRISRGEEVGSLLSAEVRFRHLDCWNVDLNVYTLEHLAHGLNAKKLQLCRLLYVCRSVNS